MHAIVPPFRHDSSRHTARCCRHGCMASVHLVKDHVQRTGQDLVVRQFVQRQGKPGLVEHPQACPTAGALPHEASHSRSASPKCLGKLTSDRRGSYGRGRGRSQWAKRATIGKRRKHPARSGSQDRATACGEECRCSLESTKTMWPTKTLQKIFMHTAGLRYGQAALSQR
jgi:hypothetical protein